MVKPTVAAVIVAPAFNVPVAPAGAASTKVDYGAISHKGVKDLGQASPGLELSLQLGLIADQSGIVSAARGSGNCLVLRDTLVCAPGIR